MFSRAARISTGSVGLRVRVVHVCFQPSVICLTIYSITPVVNVVVVVVVVVALFYPAHI